MKQYTRDTVKMMLDELSDAGLVNERFQAMRYLVVGKQPTIRINGTQVCVSYGLMAEEAGLRVSPEIKEAVRSFRQRNANQVAHAERVAVASAHEQTSAD